MATNKKTSYLFLLLLFFLDDSSFAQQNARFPNLLKDTNSQETQSLHH
jgi:hypothetical protein